MSLVHGVEQLPGFVMSHVAEISECFSPKDTSLVCGGFFDSLPIELCWFEETTGADRDTLDGLPGDRSEMLLLVSVSWKDFGRQAGYVHRKRNMSHGRQRVISVVETPPWIFKLTSLALYAARW